MKISQQAGGLGASATGGAASTIVATTAAGVAMMVEVTSDTTLATGVFSPVMTPFAGVEVAMKLFSS